MWRACGTCWRRRDLHESGSAETLGLPRAFTTPLPASADACAGRGAVAQRVIGSGRRLIWTDDVEAGHRRADDPPDRALLISPNPSRGPRPARLRLIRRFLAGGPIFVGPQP